MLIKEYDYTFPTFIFFSYYSYETHKLFLNPKGGIKDVAEMYIAWVHPVMRLRGWMAVVMGRGLVEICRLPSARIKF